MATKQQTGQMRWCKLLAGGALGLSLTIATGCSTTPTTGQQSYDPLHGVRTPPGTPVTPGPPPPATTAATQPQPQAAAERRAGCALPTNCRPSTNTRNAGRPRAGRARSAGPLAIDAPPPGFLPNQQPGCSPAADAASAADAGLRAAEPEPAGRAGARQQADAAGDHAEFLANASGQPLGRGRPPTPRRRWTMRNCCKTTACRIRSRNRRRPACT